MNFFGLGPGEIALIAVLALIVVGPRQLPALLKQLGNVVSKGQEMQRDLRRGINDIVQETELESVTKTISTARNFTPAGAASSFLDNVMADKKESSPISNPIAGDEAQESGGKSIKNETGKPKTVSGAGSIQSSDPVPKKQPDILDSGAEETGEN